MFLGKHVLPISADGRFTLPADVRSRISGELFLTQGFERNLLLLTKDTFETVYTHVRSTSITDPAARLLSRLILGNATEVRPDESGAIQVPPPLRDFAAFGGQILLVGQGEYLELWSPDSWGSLADMLQDHGQNVQRFEKFNIPLS